jgi:integrase
MILIGFRHGLRVSELCGLQWSSIEFQTGAMHVRRARGGEAATHSPLLGDELRALPELKRQSASPSSSLRSAIRWSSASAQILGFQSMAANNWSHFGPLMRGSADKTTPARLRCLLSA